MHRAGSPDASKCDVITHRENPELSTQDLPWEKRRKVINTKETSSWWGFWLGGFSNSSEITHQIASSCFRLSKVSAGLKESPPGGEEITDPGMLASPHPHSALFLLIPEAGGVLK